MTSCVTSKTSQTKATLFVGSWQLNFISASNIDFDILYPNEKPILIFNAEGNSFAGNNSCNRFSGSFIYSKSDLKFDLSKTISTLMACQGNGDVEFMNALGKIDSYKISKDGKILSLFQGKTVLLKFDKK